jgi:Nif-specific regulatory protein
MDADRGTFYLVDRARGELFSKAAQLPELREIRLALGQGVAGFVARTGEAVNLPSSASDPRFHGAVDRKTGYATRSMLCVPVHDRAGDILGVLQLLNKKGAAFTTDDEALLRALASQVAMIVESTSLYPQLRAPTPPRWPTGSTASSARATACAGSTTWSRGPPRPTRPCSSPARPGPARA